MGGKMWKTYPFALVLLVVSCSKALDTSTLNIRKDIACYNHLLTTNQPCASDEMMLPVTFLLGYTSDRSCHHLITTGRIHGTDNIRRCCKQRQNDTISEYHLPTMKDQIPNRYYVDFINTCTGGQNCTLSTPGGKVQHTSGEDYVSLQYACIKDSIVLHMKHSKTITGRDVYLYNGQNDGNAHVHCIAYTKECYNTVRIDIVAQRITSTACRITLNDGHSRTLDCKNLHSTTYQSKVHYVDMHINMAVAHGKTQKEFLWIQATASGNANVTVACGSMVPKDVSSRCRAISLQHQMLTTRKSHVSTVSLKGITVKTRNGTTRRPSSRSPSLILRSSIHPASSFVPLTQSMSRPTARAGITTTHKPSIITTRSQSSRPIPRSSIHPNLFATTLPSTPSVSTRTTRAGKTSAHKPSLITKRSPISSPIPISSIHPNVLATTLPSTPSMSARTTRAGIIFTHKPSPTLKSNTACYNFYLTVDPPCANNEMLLPVMFVLGITSDSVCHNLISTGELHDDDDNRRCCKQRLDDKITNYSLPSMKSSLPGYDKFIDVCTGRQGQGCTSSHPIQNSLGEDYATFQFACIENSSVLRMKLNGVVTGREVYLYNDQNDGEAKVNCMAYTSDCLATINIEIVANNVSSTKCSMALNDGRDLPPVDCKNLPATPHSSPVSHSRGHFMKMSIFMTVDPSRAFKEFLWIKATATTNSDVTVACGTKVPNVSSVKCLSTFHRANRSTSN